MSETPKKKRRPERRPPPPITIGTVLGEQLQAIRNKEARRRELDALGFREVKENP